MRQEKMDSRSDARAKALTELRLMSVEALEDARGKLWEAKVYGGMSVREAQTEMAKVTARVREAYERGVAQINAAA